jgi:hypothetical protein
LVECYFYFVYKDNFASEISVKYLLKRIFFPMVYSYNNCYRWGNYKQNIIFIRSEENRLALYYNECKCFSAGSSSIIC